MQADVADVFEEVEFTPEELRLQQEMLDEIDALYWPDWTPRKHDAPSMQWLVELGYLSAADALRIDVHNVTHPEPLSPYGWTAEKVLARRVRPSRQEAQALRNFAHAQRA